MHGFVKVMTKFGSKKAGSNVRNHAHAVSSGRATTVGDGTRTSGLAYGGGIITAFGRVNIAGIWCVRVWRRVDATL